MNKSILSINSLSKYSELFQIVGVIGLIASLIFVGIELRQSQQIALAEQQVERTKAFVDVYNTATNNGLAFMNFDNDYNKEEIFQVNFWHIFWNLSETDYLKYRLGLMDENIWQAKLNAMEFVYNSCLSRHVFDFRKSLLDARLVSLIEDFPDACTN